MGSSAHDNDKKWILGPSKRSKNEFWDVHEDPKTNLGLSWSFRAFRVIQKLILGPSKLSKN